jgi:hypothetical protein
MAGQERRHQAAWLAQVVEPYDRAQGLKACRTGAGGAQRLELGGGPAERLADLGKGALDPRDQRPPQAVRREMPRTHRDRPPRVDRKTGETPFTSAATPARVAGKMERMERLGMKALENGARRMSARRDCGHQWASCSCRSVPSEATSAIYSRLPSKNRLQAGSYKSHHPVPFFAEAGAGFTA